MTAALPTGEEILAAVEAIRKEGELNQLRDELAGMVQANPLLVGLVEVSGAACVNVLVRQSAKTPQLRAAILQAAFEGACEVGLIAGFDICLRILEARMEKARG